MLYTEKTDPAQAGNYQPHNNIKYGVYALRAEYHVTIIKSLSLVCMMIAAIALFTRVVSPNRKLPEINKGNLDNPIYTVPVSLPFEEPVAPAAPQNPDRSTPPPNTSNAGLLTIVDDKNPTEPVVTFSGATGPEINTGDTGTGDVQVQTEGNGTTTSTVTYTAPAEPYMVDKMPEFEGGMNALYKFIYSKIRYPEEARDLNKDGDVGIQFIVDTDGSVLDITFLKTAGYGMDEEAKRVIGLLPRFKTPGMVKGVPVQVYYKMPIKFRIQ